MYVSQWEADSILSKGWRTFVSRHPNFFSSTHKVEIFLKFASLLIFGQQTQHALDGSEKQISRVFSRKPAKIKLEQKSIFHINR